MPKTIQVVGMLCKMQCSEISGSQWISSLTCLKMCVVTTSKESTSSRHVFFDSISGPEAVYLSCCNLYLDGDELNCDL